MKSNLRSFQPKAGMFKINTKILQKHYSKILFVLLIILALLFFGKRIVAILAIIFFLSLGILSLIWKRFVRLSLGFELITFVTVLFAISYGAFFAITTAVIMVIVGNYFAGRICLPMFVQIAAYVLVAIVASFFAAAQVKFAGMLCAVIFNLVLHLTYVFFMRFRIENSIMSFVLNLVVNFWLFSTVAGAFIKFL